MDQTQVVVDGSLGDDLPVVRDSEAGMGLAGGGRQRVMRASDWSDLPPCPGPAVIAPASIPGPPLIRLETSEDDRVQLCLTAYRLVCSRRWPSEWNPYSRGELKPADRKLLVAAAEALCNHQVSPIRWAEFSADQWEHARAAQQAGGKGKKGGRGGNRMPLKMAFSVGRIEEHGGWCRHERERRGSRTVWTRSLRTLMAKWQAMRAAVLRGEVTAGDAAGKFFPGDSWERLVYKATADARLEQQRIDTAIAGGEYLW